MLLWRLSENRALAEEGESAEIRYSTHRTRRLVLAATVAVMVVVIAVASATYLLPAVENEYFSPAPVWRTFSGVFDSSGTLALEGCSLQNTQQVLPGIGIGRAVQSTIVICTFRGGTYTGYYGKDCNMLAAGPVVIVNGAPVPLGGCELSQAPLNIVLHQIFTLGKGSARSMVVYQNKKAVANMTTAGNWTTYGCALETSNLTRTNGPLTCSYMGTPYTAPDILLNCNMGATITVNSVTVPPNSCYLERSEAVSG